MHFHLVAHFWFVCLFLSRFLPAQESPFPWRRTQPSASGRRTSAAYGDFFLLKKRILSEINVGPKKILLPKRRCRCGPRAGNEYLYLNLVFHDKLFLIYLWDSRVWGRLLFLRTFATPSMSWSTGHRSTSQPRALEVKQEQVSQNCIHYCTSEA